jgi:hypothetical protein
MYVCVTHAAYETDLVREVELLGVVDQVRDGVARRGLDGPVGGPLVQLLAERLALQHLALVRDLWWG